MRSPRIGRDFVLAPTRIAPSLWSHFEKREIVKAGFVEPPCSAQAGYATAHDDKRNLDALRGLSERSAVAQAMTERVRLIHERASDGALGLGGEADQPRAEESAA
jgi:hypothetical protein